MDNIDPQKPGFARINMERVRPSGPKRYLLPILAFLIPLLAAALLFWWFRSDQAQFGFQKKLGLDSWQSANLSALEAEIENLKNALSMPPCEMPELSTFGEGPGFAPGSQGKSALLNESQPQAPLENPLPATPLEPPIPPNDKPLAGQETGPPSRPIAGESLPDLVERATVMVLVDAPGELVQGTGFFISPRIILTNRHVIEPMRRNRTASRALVTNKTLGRAVQARLLWSTPPDKLRDYAFLELDPPQDSHPSVLALNGEIKRADHISSWGYPMLYTKTDPQMAALFSGEMTAIPEVVYSEGVVSVLQEVDGLPLINHTADVSHGNSGGPLVNVKGEVVGINTMIRLDEQSNRQVNIALGSRDIIKVAAQLGLSMTGTRPDSE